jgi:hypothetical protein
MPRVGQNHIYTVYIRYFWQGNHQMYGRIRCIYTVLANPAHSLKQITTNYNKTALLANPTHAHSWHPWDKPVLSVPVKYPQIYPSSCHHLSPSSSSIIICHHLSSTFTIHHHLPPSIIIFHHLSSSFTICHHLSSPVVICYHFSEQPPGHQRA